MSRNSLRLEKWQILVLTAVIIFLPIPSTRLWPYQELLASLVALVGGVFCLSSLIRSPQNTPNDKPGSRRAAVIIAWITTILLGVMGTYLGTNAAEDLFLPNLSVEGRIEKKLGNVGGTGKSWLPVSYGIVVNGQRFKVTHDIYKHLNIGDSIHGEATAGSHIIIKIKGDRP